MTQERNWHEIEAGITQGIKRWLLVHPEWLEGIPTEFEYKPDYVRHLRDAMGAVTWIEAGGIADFAFVQFYDCVFDAIRLAQKERNNHDR